MAGLCSFATMVPVQDGRNVNAKVNAKVSAKVIANSNGYYSKPFSNVLNWGDDVKISRTSA